MTLPDDKRLGVVDEATPVGWCASEAAAVHRCLDDRDIPRRDGGKVLSLWGRVLRFGQTFVQGSNDPDDLDIG